ncbi:MAG: hypothetical protein CMJ64_10315 [Planctomycetaceae bacterium]|nr:hypothetical protein [Planctomycetaceae bacterium]
MSQYWKCHGTFAAMLVIASAVAAKGADPQAASKDQTLSVEQIVELVRPSLVTISTSGRESREHGLGTGFVVSEDGLIATNLHVIGEGREFSVELADGTDLKVVSVHASDRHRDLAIIKVAPGDKVLKPLAVSDSNKLEQGQPIVVMGNPLGFKQSVVSGVVSAIREIEGQEMLQLAIPIERGNSGGPVVDRTGLVHGIVNMKSLREESVGFAVDIKHLRSLLDKPNPIALSRWATIGALDESQWTPLLGARWRQRAGKILVTEQGTGFGGRSLCISKVKPPEIPFELAVTVKLNDESGAAGLIFHSDSGHKHYGFYPTGGKLRLTCFQGPTVFTWKILKDVATEHYRPGEWNRLKVRIEKDGIKCFVNDQLAIESADGTYTSGQVGLAKFRHTEADFKHFQAAKEIASTDLSEEEVDRLTGLVSDLPQLLEVKPGLVAALADSREASGDLLERRAAALERQAKELRKVAADVHAKGVVADLIHLVKDGDDFDLMRGALLLAKLDERDIDIEGYLEQVDRMAREITAKLPKDAGETQKRDALAKYLFEENGFHGSRSAEYYHRANSYMNRVIDDREAIPVTLSVLYMELGRRIGLKIEGVGMPSHFIVRHVPAEGEPQLLDVFERAALLSRDDAAAIVLRFTGRELADSDLEVSPNRRILLRMIANLWGLARSETDGEAMLRYAEARVAIDPTEPAYRDERAQLRAFGGRLAAAVEDLDWLLERRPEGLDVDRIHQMRSAILERLP